jgi:hypothetical protein
MLSMGPRFRSRCRIDLVSLGPRFKSQCQQLKEKTAIWTIVETESFRTREACSCCPLLLVLVQMLLLP